MRTVSAIGTTLTVTSASGVLANDTNVDGRALNAVLGTTTSNGSLTLHADGSFSYTPNAGFSGTDSFSYTATDGIVTSQPATVTITVYSVAVANADAYTAYQGVTLSVLAAQGVLANDTDADGRTLTAMLVTGPAHGSLTLNADGSFSYTSNPTFLGADSFTYAAVNGTTISNSATVTITVNPTLVANAYNYTTPENVTLRAPRC